MGKTYFGLTVFTLEESVEQSHLVALKRLRRAESRGPHITEGLS